jgi:hypothetical protein
MFGSTVKKLLVAALISAPVLVGCLQGEDDGEVPNIHLKVSTKVDGVELSSAGLAKGSTILYSKMIITLTSNSLNPSPTDTVRDTILVGEQNFGSSSTVDYAIDSNYSLKGLRVWKATVEVRDQNDSLIHYAASTPSTHLKLGADTTLVVLNLSPRFNMYRAIFTNLPDSITTPPPVTNHKQGMRFTALFLKVDGKIVKTLTSAAFPPGPANPDTLDYDYVLTGPRTIRLVAFGSLLNASGAVVLTDSLFAGEVTITPVVGQDGAQTFSLGWTNPQNVNGKGTETISVTVGRVGKTTLNGVTSGVGVIAKESAR